MEDNGYGEAQWYWDMMEPSGGFYEEEAAEDGNHPENL